MFVCVCIAKYHAVDLNALRPFRSSKTKWKPLNIVEVTES